MTASARHDKALLFKTARAVAAELDRQAKGTPIRVRQPARIGSVNTGGWRVSIGDLGKGRPRLQIWLDKFAGYPERKFSICFYAPVRKTLRAIALRVARKVRLVRQVTEDDVAGEQYNFLRARLRRAEFNQPVLEEYCGRYTFFGIYDPSVRLPRNALNPYVCARAVAFFSSVARTLPGARPEDSHWDVYQRIENRQWVVSHLHRERNVSLATDRKIADDYKCQVCGLRFKDRYGKLGECFAEAHHRVPLSKLNGKVKTRIKDLATVCANCHRMLHRMNGRRGDVEALGKIVRQARRR